MIDIEKFRERLKYLMLENELNGTQLAEKINVSKLSVSRYVRGTHLPTVDVAVRIADYFKVSLDYLLGSEENNRSDSFLPCPPFSERLRLLLEQNGISKYRLNKDTKIDDESIYSWLYGRTKPSLENVVRLSEYFDCTVDYLLGRE